MDLKQLLQAIETGALLDKASVIFLRGHQEYPLLFCSLLIAKLRQTTSTRIEALDSQTFDHARLSLLASTSFLGMKSCYWLYNVSGADASQKKALQQLFSSYQGPNTLIFFAVSSFFTIQSEHVLVIDIPDTCTKELFLELACFTDATDIDPIRLFAQQLFSTTKEIPLDTACRLMNYVTLLGMHQAVFIKHWLSYFIDTERSLFTLSQHLFAKQEKAFFAAWQHIIQEYSDIFWVSFWSEQLWRATTYIHLMRMNNRAEAEKVAYRLPFSFKNRGWLTWHTSELIAAHSFLSSTDTILKNGGNIFSLELFYSKLFAGHFANISKYH